MDLPGQTVSQARDSLWRLAEPDRRAVQPCLVRRIGEALDIPVRAPGAWLTLEDESGAIQAVRVADDLARLPPLPIGRYRLRLDDRLDTDGHLIVAPGAAFLPPALDAGARVFGLSAQLYGVRRQGDQGIGDFTTLGQLVEGAGAQGAAMIGLNPQHALFHADRERASPYGPSDRRFLDPIYLDVPGLPEAAALAALDHVDYPGVWAAKSRALEARFARFAGSPGLNAFIQAGGQTLADFAVFQAIAESQLGAPWFAWPQDLRSPRASGVAAFAAARADRVRYHQYLQWLCEQQLADVQAGGSLAIGLCRDLAVGAAPDGAEAWAGAERLALDVSIGAPPDPLGPDGQVWGLPPPIPRRWQEEGYDSFAGLLRANMRHAGALRIDHVLGLARLFWVPQGADGRHGAYVAYPLQDLLGVLALESVRARCLVIGEDLGTVPDGLRAALSSAGVFSYKVLPFERDGGTLRPPPAYPARGLACVATHDLPPLAGWWSGVDIDERVAIGLLTPTEAQPAHLERAADRAVLLTALDAAGLGSRAWTADGPLTPALAGAIHAYIAASPSQLAMAQVEDMAGETVAVNLPGTDRERPNWRRRLGLDLDALWSAEPARSILQGISQGRR
jgi:glycogen operon protein